MNKKTFYRQISQLTVTRQGKEEVNLFERTIALHELKRIGEKSVAYDSNLGIYFEKRSVDAYVYDIDIDKVRLFLSSRIQGATDFNTRLMYLYDWLQVSINSSGSIRATHNREEVRNNWQKLKQKIKADYKGEAVDEYFLKIDKQLESSQYLWNCLREYFNFGLIFHTIPTKHDKEWTRKRKVLFSGYENSYFEEEIDFEKTKDNRRIYKIGGSAFEDSCWTVEQYEGELIVLENEILPEQYTVNTVFRLKDGGGDINRWEFKLHKVML